MKDTQPKSVSLCPDPWVAGVPRTVKWTLNVLTIGLCAPVWRFPARVWGPALLSAVLFFTSFAGWDIWPLGYVFAVPLFYAIDACKNPREAAWISLWMGWIGNFGGFYWITELLVAFAQMHFLVALPIAVLLSCTHGIVFAGFGFLVFKIRERTSWPMVLLAPALWPALEMVTPLIFPNYVGNNQYLVTPMIQIAEYLGPLAVSAMVFLANGILYDLLLGMRAKASPQRRRLFVGAGVGAVIIAANLALGFVRIAQVEEEQKNAPTVRFGLVEANIGNVRGKKARANMLLAHQRLSKELEQKHQVDLMVWPESTFRPPTVFSSTSKSKRPTELVQTLRATRWIPVDSRYLQPSRAPLVDSAADDVKRKTPPIDRNAVQRGFHTPILFASNSMRQLSAQEMKTDPPNKERKIKGKWVTRDYRTYNSAVLLDEGGFVQGIQHKNNLLAFGEYIPFADVWPGVYRVLQTSEFTPGTEATLLPFEGYKLGVMICLEDILPAYGRELAAQSPDVLVNLTNDAWYGKTHEPFLHFSLATMRTVETRKWLVRATNTGVSAFVDATGRIVAQTSIYDPETLVFDVPMMKGPPTLYSRIGDVCGYLSLFFTMALLGVALRKEKHKNTA